MAWLETIRIDLYPLLYTGSLMLFIAILTIGLAWGIRPAIQFLLSRLGTRWSSLGASFIQVVVVVGGMVLLVIAVGVNALIILIALIVAFVCGLTVGGETLLADNLATIRIHLRKLYRVGDMVTLGSRYHGVVQQIGRTQTQIEDANRSRITVRNSFAVRNPLIVHLQPPSTPVTEPSEEVELNTNEAALPNPEIPSTVVTEQPQLEPTVEPQAMPPHVVQHSIAVPLLRRKGLGKRTVQELR